MKLMSLLILLPQLASAQSLAFGDWSGSGGSGVDGVFRSLGDMFVQHLRMAHPSSKPSGLFELDPDHFAQAIRSTPIVLETNEEKMKDSKGVAQTAIFLSNPSRIQLHPDRFMREIQQGPEVAMVTVVHEYLKAAKLDDRNFQIMGRHYNSRYFNLMLKDARNLAIFERKTKTAEAWKERLALLKSHRRELLTEIASDRAVLEDVVREYSTFQGELHRHRMKMTAARANAMAKALEGMSIMRVLSNPLKADTAPIKGAAGMAQAGIGIKSKPVLDTPEKVQNFMEKKIANYRKQIDTNLKWLDKYNTAIHNLILGPIK